MFWLRSPILPGRWDRLPAGHSLAEHSPANFPFARCGFSARWGEPTGMSALPFAFWVSAAPLGLGNIFWGRCSQGVALGYLLSALQAFHLWF